MNLGQIADLVDRRVQRTGLAGMGDQIRDAVRAEILMWQREPLWPVARAERPTIGEPHSWSFLRSSHTWTCTAGDAYHALPSGFLRPVRLRLTVSGAAVRPTLGNYDYLLDKWLGAADAVPQEYAVDRETGQLVLFPPPREAYAALLRYAKLLPDLTGDGDSNAFTSSYWAGLSEGAAARVLEDLRQWDEADKWRGRATASLARAIAEDRSRMKEDDIALFATPNAGGTREDPRPIMEGEVVMRRINPLDP